MTVDGLGGAEERYRRVVEHVADRPAEDRVAEVGGRGVRAEGGEGHGRAGHAIVPDGDGDGEASAAWTVNGGTAAPARRLASGSRLGC